MSKKIINIKGAPAPIGPYNQGVEVNGFLYLSGQIPLDPMSGDLIKGSIQEQTHQVMKNIQSLLNEAGMDWTNVIKSSLFLADMENFSAINDTYASYFEKDYPARETVEVSRLPKDVGIEISVIAHRS
jgi:2-iminobutanoate/2-iminopropanoate deaminase